MLFSITSVGAFFSAVWTNKDWPAWIQGIGSLLAVVVAIWLALSERRSEKRRRAEDQERTHSADRSLLNFALDEVLGLSQSWMKSCTNLLTPPFKDFEGVHVPLPWTAPALPEQACRDIAKCIASCPRSRPAEALQHLLKNLQVSRARLSTIQDHAGSIVASWEVSYRLFEAVVLYAEASSLYSYARFENKNVTKIGREEVLGAANINLLHREDEKFSDLFFLIDKVFADPAMRSESSAASDEPR